MFYASLIEHLKSRYAGCYSNDAYYAYIAEWMEWYKGTVETFHQNRTVNNGLRNIRKEIYGLKMARRVCKDWASAILADGILITVNSTNNRSSIFVQGRKMDGGVLGSNQFDELIAVALERMFALGTVGLVVEMRNLVTDMNGNIIPSKDSEIEIKSYDATRIVPLRYSNGRVIDVAFVSKVYDGGMAKYVVSVHVLEEDGYVIYNEVVGEDATPLAAVGILPVIRTKSNKPLFSIMRTNIGNNIDLDSPMGVSIYSDSIDVLKSIDITYDGIADDVSTGKRVILMNKKLLAKDDRGNPIAPQDVKQTYMYFYGDEIDQSSGAGDKEFVMEFTPKLNAKDLCETLQDQLNVLSSSVGLGTKFYNFNVSTGVTATEYVGERNDFARNVNKLKLSVQNAVKNLVLGILHMGVAIGRNVDENATVVVRISDGVIESDTEERNQDRQDVKDGFMSRLEYRMKWYAETAEEAQRALDEIDKTTKIGG